MKQTAELLGIHRNTLRKYILAGAIKPKTWSQKAYISGLEIKNFYNKH